VTIGDGLTQSMHVVDHALHLVTVVADTKVALLEDVKLDTELQNAGLAIAKELGLTCEPCLMSDLHWFLNDLMKFEGEGAKDPCHNNVVQPSPIGGQINNVTRGHCGHSGEV
jgi:hypothetical protein